MPMKPIKRRLPAQRLMCDPPLLEAPFCAKITDWLAGVDRVLFGIAQRMKRGLAAVMIVDAARAG